MGKQQFSPSYQSGVDLTHISVISTKIKQQRRKLLALQFVISKLKTLCELNSACFCTDLYVRPTCRVEWEDPPGRSDWELQQTRPGCWHLRWWCPHPGSGSPALHIDYPPFPKLISYDSGKIRGETKQEIHLFIFKIKDISGKQNSVFYLYISWQYDTIMTIKKANMCTV